MGRGVGEDWGEERERVGRGGLLIGEGTERGGASKIVTLQF